MSAQIREVEKNRFYLTHHDHLCANEFLHGFLLGFEAAQNSSFLFLSLGEGNGCGVLAGKTLFLSDMLEESVLKFLGWAKGHEVDRLVGPRDSLRTITNQNNVVMAQTVFSMPNKIILENKNSYSFAMFQNQKLLLTWLAEFFAEGEPNEPAQSLEQIEKFSQKVFFLVSSAEGDPLSMAGIMRSTLTGVGIGAVFTPKQNRGRSAAYFCVGKLCEQIQNSGKLPFLVADEGNHSSMKLYRSMGFNETGRLIRLSI